MQNVNVVNFNGPLRQAAGSGTDSFGCPQDQYTFGTVEVALSEINPNVKYFYSIWGYGDNWLTYRTCNAEMGYRTPLAPHKK